MKQAPSRLRPLNSPRRVHVDAGADGAPAAVRFGRTPVTVEACLETWRIDDEWWRPKPVSRRYWRVLLADGRVADVYEDLTTGNWFRQAYG